MTFARPQGSSRDSSSAPSSGGRHDATVEASGAADAPTRRWRSGFALLLVAAVVLVYANIFRAPFVFDDRAAIVDNATIRSWTTAFSPPAGGAAVAGRPLLNASFALNRAWSGSEPWSYHALNVGLHAVAALLLYGVVRRLAAAQPSGFTAGNASVAGVSVALLWALHPLVTESVTSVAQRSEALAGVWLLATVYGFVRATTGVTGRLDGTGSGVWLTVSALCCLAGMATKETMVVAPLLVLLVDRTWVAGSFHAAWAERKRYYGALAATWLLLAGLVIQAGGSRGTAAGIGHGISSWSYLLRQTEAVLIYLRLVVWPDPLVFDYGTAVPSSVAEVWPAALTVLALLGVSVWALVRSPRVGFFCGTFFLLLAPSSSVIPLSAQTVAEHRMYLPLAGVVAGVMLAVAGRWGARWTAGIALVLACVAGIATSHRNATYGSELRLWADTAAKVPDNPRALSNYGAALLDAGRPHDAALVLARAAALQPKSPEVRTNLALAHLRAGELDAAIRAAEVAVQLAPADVNALVNLGAALAAAARWDDAAARLAEARRLQPDARDIVRLAADVHRKHAEALLRDRDIAAAAREVDTAMELVPDAPDLHFLAGNVAVASRDFPTAIACFRRSLTLDAGNVRARNNLANALLVTGDVDAAVLEYREVLRTNPEQPGVRENLEQALRMQRTPPTPTTIEQ